MSFANYLENKLLDHLFNKAAYTIPTIYIGLSTVDPLDDGSGLAEPSVGGYARIITSALTWATAASGLTTNILEIIFPLCTSSWGTVTHVTLHDALTVGNLLGSGALAASSLINIGDIPKFLVSDLNTTLT